MTRRTSRYGGAAIAIAMAAIYVLIGLNVLRVVDAQGGTDLLGFGAAAAALFGTGAVLLLLLDRRPLWVIGAILQVLVAAMYVAVAPSREPSFEVWGTTLRILQIPLFAALVYLALHVPVPNTASRAQLGPIDPARE